MLQRHLMLMRSGVELERESGCLVLLSEESVNALSTSDRKEITDQRPRTFQYAPCDDIWMPPLMAWFTVHNSNSTSVPISLSTWDLMQAHLIKCCLLCWFCLSFRQFTEHCAWKSQNSSSFGNTHLTSDGIFFFPLTLMFHVDSNSSPRFESA